MAVLVNVVGKYTDKDLAKAQKALDGLGKQAAGPTAKGFSKLGSEARNAIVGIGVAVFAKQSIDAFAEVQDAQSALQATYGQTGDAIIDFAERSGDALNLSKREALNAATTFANFGRAAGKTGQDLVSFTTPLIERAADAASYFGGTTADAVEAFGAALRGEMEPIRRYGVLLDDATLRAKALEMGLVSSTKNALTPQVKTLAAQALILEKTSQAQGDVARTSDSMANQIKDAQQQMDDFKVSTGETLSVAVGPLLKGMNGAIGTFNKLPQPVKSGAVAVGILGAAAVIAGPKLLAFRREIIQTEFASTKLGKAAGKTGKAMGVAGLALAATQMGGALASSLIPVNSSTDDMNALLTQLGKTGEGYDKLGYSFLGYSQTFEDALQRVASPNWWDSVQESIGNIAGIPSDLGLARQALSQVDTELANMVSSGHANDAALAVAKLRSEFAKKGDVNEFDQALTGYHRAIREATPPTVELAAGQDDLAAATKRRKTATEQLQGILDRRASLRAWKDALAGVSGAVKAADGHWTAGTAKGRAFQDWLDGSIGSLSDYASGAKDAAGQSKRWRDGIGDLREKLSKMGLSKAEIDKILKPFKAMQREARDAGQQAAIGLGKGLDDKANFALARARALGKAAALEVKAGAEVKSPSRITIKVGEELVNGLTAGVLKKQGGAKKIIRQATRDALSAANDALEQFRERGRTALDFIDSVKGNIRESGSIASFDLSGDAKPTSAGLISDKSGRVAQAEQFAKDLAKLRALKLNNADLQDIISRGPAEGDAIAQALLKGGSAAISQANSLQTRLNAAAASIGDTAGISQYGLNAAQATGLIKTQVNVSKGALVLNIGAGVTAADARRIRREFDDAIEAFVKKTIRELRS